MKSDYQKSQVISPKPKGIQSQLLMIWVITGLILGTLLSFLVGNVLVGLTMGLIVSFLIGIIWKRIRLINIEP